MDVLAAQGRAPLRSGGHAVERVLDVRRAGPRSYQVLLRWKGAHDDEWRPMAACNDLTKREAQVLIKRKFPPTEAVGLRRGARGGRAAQYRCIGAIYGVDAPRPAPRD